MSFSKTCLLACAVVAASAALNSAFAAPPSISSNLSAVSVDGNTLASGQAASVLYDAGQYHMWYRDSAGTIDGLHYANSANGLNFTTQGSPLSFSNDPFPAMTTAPYLYYENVSNVGGDYKIQHWTYNGGNGDYPDYNYNISVSSAGMSPSNTVVDHQGPIGGGTLGQTAGSFGIVGSDLYMQGGLGRSLMRATYVDGTPPSVTGGLQQVANFDAWFASAGNASGYINNHSDVVDLGGSLGFFFTVRDNAGVRIDEQVWFSESTDDGASWNTPTGLLTAPTLNGVAPGGNFAHADFVLADGSPVLYVSTQDASGAYVLATNAVPEPASIALVGLAAIGLFGAYRRRGR